MALPVDPETSTVTRQKEVLKQFSREKHPVVEVPNVPEISGIPPEIEKVEAIAGGEVALPQPVTDDTGQVIVDSPAPQQVTISLPLSEEEIERALHLKLVHSIRWLAEWTQRLIKKASGKFVYQAKQSS